jgi:hypothetical protein
MFSITTSKSMTSARLRSQNVPDPRLHVGVPAMLPPTSPKVSSGLPVSDGYIVKRHVPLSRHAPGVGMFSHGGCRR